MACENERELLHGYIDGELDLATNLEIQRHLQQCPSCARTYQQQQVLRTAISTAGLAFKAPPNLEKRIRVAAAKAEAGGKVQQFAIWPRSVAWVAMAASILIAAFLVWMIDATRARPGSDEFVRRAVLADHVRSLMADHLTDVPSSDSHTVKPWFTGKLDFSPPVKDLAAQGFPLIGGRLEYLDRPVAALVYRRRQHVINVLVWPTSSNAQGPGKPVTLQGYNLLHWTGSGMNYWAISDLSASELLQFVQLLQP
jgi:anti-sigma factor RsiW